MIQQNTEHLDLAGLKTKSGKLKLIAKKKN